MSSIIIWEESAQPCYAQKHSKQLSYFGTSQANTVLIIAKSTVGNFFFKKLQLGICFAH